MNQPSGPKRALSVRQPYAEQIICFIDEPILSAFGSSTYVSVKREDVVAHLKEVIEAVHVEGGLADPPPESLGAADSLRNRYRPVQPRPMDTAAARPGHREPPPGEAAPRGATENGDGARHRFTGQTPCPSPAPARGDRDGQKAGARRAQLKSQESRRRLIHSILHSEKIHSQEELLKRLAHRIRGGLVAAGELGDLQACAARQLTRDDISPDQLVDGSLGPRGFGYRRRTPHHARPIHSRE